MFGKKKVKIEQPLTPEELSRFNDKKIADAEIEHFHVKNDSIEIVKYKKRQRLLRVILSVCLIILIILFFVSMLVTQWGDLIISVDSPAVKKGIVISEDPEFETFGASLSATQVKDVTNITYSWLPVDLDTSENGSHNGDNYAAYTFYCKNNGEVTLDYDAYLEITGVAKSADEATRVMIYKNGEPAIYGKGKYDDRSTAETDCTKFETDTKVMTTSSEDFEVGEVDKYTIVIWIEGNDPECIDDIRNGHVRMRMLFQVRDDEETTAP
ncbi:MAG: hypothetical protein UHD05_01330 [Ruminococcus sp.]|nr:hypothetical protein [Ruminococcus sp.]MEE1318129.1 hypothetical protein [Ruminococcus sp.]